MAAGGAGETTSGVVPSPPAALVRFLAGALSSVKRQEVLARAFEYWRNIDTTIGQKIQTAANVSNPTVRIVGTGRRTAR